VAIVYSFYYGTGSADGTNRHIFGLCTPSRRICEIDNKGRASLAEQKAARISRKAEAAQRFKKMGSWR
jgi:hypothetical protein